MGLDLNKEDEGTPLHAGRPPLVLAQSYHRTEPEGTVAGTTRCFGGNGVASPERPNAARVVRVRASTSADWPPLPE
jgi:hypothetical protein